MQGFAVIDGSGIVQQVVYTSRGTVKTDLEVVILQSGDDVAVGYGYENGMFIAPPPPPPVPGILVESPPPEPDWALADQLRGTTIFQKAFAASSVSLAANTAYTTLLSGMHFQSASDLKFAFNALRAALPSTPVGDFSATDLATVRSLLIAHQFPLEGFNLS